MAACVGIPTVEDARDWGGLEVDSFSDEDVQQILDAELDIQTRTLAVPVDEGEGCVWPSALARSLLRRVQRQCALRAVALGYVSDIAAEYGPITISTWDAEVARLESSYVRHVVA